jgi:hypothetical protein
MALDAAAAEHSCSDRPARGRVWTMGRISPTAARRVAASAVVLTFSPPSSRAGYDAPVVVVQRRSGGDMAGRGGSSPSTHPQESLSPPPTLPRTEDEVVVATIAVDRGSLLPPRPLGRFWRTLELLGHPHHWAASTGR